MFLQNWMAKNQDFWNSNFYFSISFHCFEIFCRKRFRETVLSVKPTEKIHRAVSTILRLFTTHSRKSNSRSRVEYPVHVLFNSNSVGRARAIAGAFLKLFVKLNCENNCRSSLWSVMNSCNTWRGTNDWGFPLKIKIHTVRASSRFNSVSSTIPVNFILFFIESIEKILGKQIILVPKKSSLSLIKSNSNVLAFQNLILKAFSLTHLSCFVTLWNWGRDWTYFRNINTCMKFCSLFFIYFFRKNQSNFTLHLSLIASLQSIKFFFIKDLSGLHFATGKRKPQKPLLIESSRSFYGQET